MAVIRGWQRLAQESLEFLRREARFSMVVIPEALAVRQLDTVVKELSRYGLGFTRLIVNNVLQVTDSDFLAQKAAQQRDYLEQLRKRYAPLPIIEVPLFPQEVRGMERLRNLGRLLAAPEPPSPSA